MTSIYNICDCGKFKCWIDENSISSPCPNCGAKYKYNISKKSGTMEITKVKKKSILTKIKELF